MNQYVVGVLRDGEDGERFYRLDATTTEDALQLAFAMDGAYGPNDRSGTVQDETGTLALAKMYCRCAGFDSRLDSEITRYDLLWNQDRSS